MDAHETTIYSAVLIFSIIIGAILIFFIITIIRHQRRNQALYKSKIQAEISTLEKERTRIAADLHDELGPVLSAVKFKINSLDIGSEEDNEQLNKANRHIDDIISRMREISNDLMPNTLLRKGLVAAIEEAIDNLDKTAGLHIAFTQENIPELKKEMAVNLYRIIQEIIHNTIKHAKAHVLKIELKMKDRLLIVLTQDDGLGFDHTAAVREKAGLGLRSMLSRAEVMGGEMYIESKPGKGTTYIFEIPLS